MIIRVLLCEPGRKPRWKLVADDVDDFRRLLGGCELEFNFYDWGGPRPFALICDDHALARKLPCSYYLRGPRGETWPLCGAFFITTVEGDRHTSLTEEELVYFAEWVRPLTQQQVDRIMAGGEL